MGKWGNGEEGNSQCDPVIRDDNGDDRVTQGEEEIEEESRDGFPGVENQNDLEQPVDIIEGASDEQHLGGVQPQPPDERGRPHDGVTPAVPPEQCNKHSHR